MILLIDNYDSFTYNLYQYLSTFDKVKVVRNDCITLKEIKEMKPDRIVISPGPKTPDEAGICIDLIKEFYKSVPILGICLGHQSIGQAFGAEIVYAKKLCHGKADNISHSNKGIFKDLPSPMQGARYHSLSIKEDTLPEELEILATVEDGEIMAVQHKEYPLVGLQFHPESVYTPEGMRLLENFIAMRVGNS